MSKQQHHRRIEWFGLERTKPSSQAEMPPTKSSCSGSYLTWSWPLPGTRYPQCPCAISHLPAVVLRLLAMQTASSCPVPRYSLKKCYVFSFIPVICSLVSSPWERRLQAEQQSCFLRDNVCFLGAKNAPWCPQAQHSGWPGHRAYETTLAIKVIITGKFWGF